MVTRDSLALPAPTTSAGAGVWSAVISFSRRKPVAAVSGFVILLLLMVAVFAPQIAQYPYDEPHVRDRLQGPSASYWLGTDGTGRDTFSRLVYGTRVTMIVSVGAVALATVIAGTIGVVTGYLGGLVDTLGQRLVDIWMSLPGLVLIISVVAVFGTGITQLLVILGFVFAGGTSRVIRSATIAIRSSMFIEAAHAVGAPHARVMFRYILPNVLPTMIVVATVQLGGIILVESALSFLGYGVPPPFPSWGSMLNTSTTQHMLKQPMLSVWPGLAITCTVFCFNMLGDGLRDVLDPRMRGSR